MNFLEYIRANLFSAFDFWHLIVAAIIAFLTVFAGKIAQYFLDKFIENLFTKHSCPICKINLNKINTPFLWLIYSFGFYAAISVLQPSDSVFPVKTTIDLFLHTFGILMFAWMSFVLVDFFDKFFTFKYEESSNPILKFVPLLTIITKTSISIFVAINILQYFGHSVSTLIAGLGILGVAVSFASKEYIANVFGAFAIIADGTYKIGDIVTLDKNISGSDVEGTVESISLRSTKIRAFDDSMIIVPNNIVGNSIVKNASMRTKRRISEFVDITYDTSSQNVEKAVAICKKIADENPKILKDYKIYFNELGSSAVRIMLIMFVDTTDLVEYLKVREQYFFKLFEEFNKENIEFAFPSQTLYVKNS